MNSSEIKRKVAEEYIKIAYEYDKTRFGEPYRLVWHELEVNLMKKLLRRDFSILEVGVGTGRFALSLTKFVKTFIGVDISLPMLKLSKEKIANASIDNVDFVNADAEHLPFKSNTFDLVFSMHVMWHLPFDVQENILSELVRVTKPGGKIIFDTGNARTISLTHKLRHKKIDFEKVGYFIDDRMLDKIISKYRLKLVEVYGFRQFLPFSHKIPNAIQNNTLIIKFIKCINNLFSKCKLFRLIALSIYFVFEKRFDA